MEKDTYPNPKVVGLAKKMVPVMIDVDKDPAPARKYEVGGLPLILFLDAKGKKIHAIEGYLEPDDFAREMQVALDKSKKK